jgi:hypothetical protein
VQPLMKTPPPLLLMPMMMMLAIRVLSRRVAAVWTKKTRNHCSRDIQRVMVVQVQGPTARSCMVCWPAAVQQVVMLPVVLR